MTEPSAKIVKCGKGTKILHEQAGYKLNFGVEIYIMTNTEQIKFCPICGCEIELEDKAPRHKRK